MLLEALTRMPHSGQMRLIASIDSADEQSIRCRATPHDGADYPLRLEGVLYTVSLVELGAQAAAAHASVYKVGGAHTGLVLTISDATFDSDCVDSPAPLSMTAVRQDLIASAASYRFEVAQEDHVLASGSVLLSMEAAQP